VPSYPVFVLRQKQLCLQPWQITGITDGDGNFSIHIIRRLGQILFDQPGPAYKKKDGWLVIPSFNLTCGFWLFVPSAKGETSPANLQMLSCINSFFGGKGHVSTNGNVYQLRIMGYKKNCLIVRSLLKSPLVWLCPSFSGQDGSALLSLAEPLWRENQEGRPSLIEYPRTN
jgi:hypothetical protein